MSTESKAKTHWKKFFNYDYLGTYSLPDGKDIILTISHVVKEKVKGAGGREEECMILHFQQDSKPMVLNRTNSKTISKIYNTPYVEEWTGLTVQLYAQGGIEAFGSITDGLRIREMVPVSISPEEAKIKAMQSEIRTLLKSYKKEDRAKIISDLKENKSDLIFLNLTINQLKK